MLSTHTQKKHTQNKTLWIQRYNQAESKKMKKYNMQIATTGKLEWLY